MRNSRSIFRVGCWTLALVFVAVSGSAAEPYAVRFHSGTVVPEAGFYDVPATQKFAPAKQTHVLVQLDDHLQKGQRQALQAAGVDLLAYLPDRAYAATVRADADLNRLRTLGVRHISAFHASYKLHPRVTEQSFAAWSDYGGGRRIFAVEIMPDVSLDEAALLLEQAGAEAGHRWDAAHTILIAIEPHRISEIAAVDAVLFINEAPPPLSEVNDVVRTRLFVNEIQAAPYNLSGTGTTILVYDGGMVDSTHPDFQTRVRWSETGAIAAHATHVAGTVGGAGVQNNAYRGMAPAARIISGEYDACIPYCLYESPNDFEADYTQARVAHGIKMTTNSIGANIDPNGYPCAWLGDYETTSRLLDRLISNTAGTPLIMFFAAGNERNGSNCGMPTYACMSVPAGAKNIISVGATTSTDGMASFSSYGPTDDGRIKPEISATGVNVTSCSPGPGYGYQDMSGTSMATPAAAGTALLILEQWYRIFPGSPDPLPETMKAILINSTTDIEAAGPDYRSGFGLVNGLKAVQNLIAGGVLESALEVGEVYSRQFTVPAATPQLDVSIAWSDIPAAGNVIPTLVNDLDLLLIDPSSAEHLPWKLRTNNPAAPAQRGVDSVNVCERVTVMNPVAGTWTLRVTGRLNGSESQTFGLSANVALVQGWATISGRVRNAANSVGIPGKVFVVGSSQGVLTSDSGNYQLSVPGNATYPVRAISYGFVPQTAQVTVGTGNTTQNFSLTAAQNGTLNGTVRNQFNAPLAGSTIEIRFPRATIPQLTVDANGAFSTQLPGANTYEVVANYFGAEVSGTVLVPENGTATLNLVITDARFAPAGPDNYGYFAYEITDPGLSAVYSWLEISPQAGGPGTAVQGTGNDWVTNVTLPFPMRFYGQEHTQIHISADGWVGIGAFAGGDTLYRNVSIPTARVPNGMICLFWDDLYPYHASGGDVSHYHDAANGRFIIEYRNVAHFNPTTNRVTGQVIIYNQAARPTITGDNEFQLQFQQVDYEGPGGQIDADATIGIENFTGTDGLQVVYDRAYHQSCFQIAVPWAARFTTGVVAGYGTVQGHIDMVPPPPDITQALIRFGQYTANPDVNGNYRVPDVMATTYSMTVTYASYETGRVDALVVPVDSTVTQNFELFRLDPATNLSGEYDWTVREIRLNWNRPAWQAGLSADQPDRNDRLDAFTGYDVYQSGTVLASVTDTFFTFAVTQSRQYDFWIKALYTGGNADTSNHYRVAVNLAVDPLTQGIPSDYYLAQNYPNPFNPRTRIEYGLPHAAHVALTVYDVLGRQVAILADGIQAAGRYAAEFDGRELGSGVFYYRLQAGEFEQIGKMLLLR